jgi:hypothetical protein
VKDIADHVHLGQNGVLRIFDPAKPTGDRVGFDLRQLFTTGVSPEALGPSELHVDVAVGGKDSVVGRSSRDFRRQRVGSTVAPPPAKRARPR